MKRETKGDLTKKHLINVGSRLFHLQGYKNTGLSQILKEAAVTKGSFYFHFEDKEAFGLAILEFYIELFKASSKEHLNNNRLSPLEKIAAFHHYHLNYLADNHYQCGCLLGNFSQEMSSLHPQFAEKIAEAFDDMASSVSDVLCEGILMGDFKSIDDIDAVSNFFVNSWEGALVRMKSVKNEAPLENWYLMMKKILFNQI